MLKTTEKTHSNTEVISYARRVTRFENDGTKTKTETFRTVPVNVVYFVVTAMLVSATLIFFVSTDPTVAKTIISSLGDVVKSWVLRGPES